ncbi:MAG TPA: DUF4355 domain-containing protein [Tissierellaceae bacterium]|nr:DUF4355 domain-containing protein [Tissierellaceae bacterium]
MKNNIATLKDNSNLKGRKLNLQLFADEGDNADNKDTSNSDNKDNKDTQEPQTYTQDELDKLLQAESDRRVSSAREKFEKEFEEKLDKEKKEAERLSKLSGDEKEKELIRKQQEQLAEKEKAIQLRELQLDTVNLLAEEKLPVGFAEFLIKNNAETTNENVKKFKKEWQDSLSKAVDERIKGESPRKPPTDLGTNQVTDFMKLASEASIRK